MGAMQAWLRDVVRGYSRRGGVVSSWQALNRVDLDRPSTSLAAAESDLLAACRAIAPVVLEMGDEIEAARRLPPRLLALLKQHGFFSMVMPKSWGGHELDPIAQHYVIRELSSLDASVGWCVMIGTDGGYFSAFMDQSVARAMYQDVNAVTGAGIFPAGKASRVAGGYRVTGHWKFGSGCQYADWMAGGCLVYAFGAPLPIHLNGQPRMLVCMLPASVIQVRDTWTTTGLRGSGSHDWSVEDVFVPEAHTFDILQPKCHRPEPLYQLPGMFMYNFPAVAIGLAHHALSAFIDIARNKPMPFKLTATLADESRTRLLLGRVIARVAAAEAFYLHALNNIWQTLQNPTGAPGGLNPFHSGTAYDYLSVDQRIRIRLAMNEVHDTCVEAVDQLYKAAGGASLYSNCILDRLLRDVHTIRQHVIVADRAYEVAGSMTLGIPPSEPFF